MRDPIDHGIGDQVIITEASLARMRTDNRNRTAGRSWTSDATYEAAERIFAAGTVGVVSHRHRPGFACSVIFGDLCLHMKEQFMEPAGLELRPAAERLAELSEEIVKATSLGKNPDLRVLSLIVAATRDLQKEARPEVLIEISDGIATVGAVNGSVRVSFADLDVEDHPDEDDLEDALDGDVFTGTAADLEAAKAKFRQELEDRTGGFEP